MNSIIETEYEYILKITEKTSFPVENLPHWLIDRQKNQILVANHAKFYENQKQTREIIQKKNRNRKLLQNRVFKIHRKQTSFFATKIPFDDGTLFLSKNTPHFRFEQDSHRRFLQANNILSWKQKSPNRTYHLKQEDRFDTDGKVRLVKGQTRDGNSIRIVHIQGANYVLVYQPRRWRLYSLRSPQELHLPRINSKDVCGLCKNFDYSTSECKIQSKDVLYCTNGCENFCLQPLLTEPTKQLTPVYQPHMWAIGQ